MKSLSTSLLLSAAALLVSAGEPIPLQPGNTWTYRNNATGETFTISVGLQQLYANEHVYHRLTGYTTSSQWVRFDELGNLVFWDQEANLETILTRFGPSFDDWVPAPFRPCPSDAMLHPGAKPFSGPAGRWNAARTVEYRGSNCSEKAPVLEQFADNVGMVRQTRATEAGLQEFDLVRARLGTVILDADSPTRFQLAVRPHPRQSGVRIASFRLTAPPLESLKLTFPTMQETELALRDERGALVWLWSRDNGLVFGQAEVNLTVQGEKEWSLEVPVENLPRGRYTLEGWLTAGPQGREYSAVVPFEVR